MCSNALASDVSVTSQMERTIEAEIQNIGTIYKVTAPNKSLAKRAAISFHSNLLETSSNKLQHIMTLTSEDVAVLKSFGFKIRRDKTWEDNYRQQRQQQMVAPSDTSLQSIPGYSCYPTVEETFTSADALAATNPTLATAIDIGDSWEKTAGQGGYDLKVLKITNQAVSGDKPKLFIHSAMHAREYTTAALTLEFATQLLSNYGTDADATWIIDHHELHILFHMNPDGRKQAETGISWRKNTNQNYCGATSNSRGTDLNRNFTHHWDVTNGQGSSGNQCSSTYRGPFAASEPETSAVEAYVRSLFQDRRGPSDTDAAPVDTQGLHLDIHSYSELMLWPWGHTNTAAPNGTALQTLGRKLAFWNGYTPEQSIGLYPTDGTSDSISYGELGVPHYTYELGTAFFQACSTYENTIKPDNLPSLEYASKILRAPYLMPAGPEVYNVSLDGSKNQNVEMGTQVNLAATANDARYENGNGTEPSQNVTEAEYYIDVLPWETGSSANAMLASDGSFNNSSESVSDTIDTSGLSLGQHMIYVRAKDANGQWGAGSAGFLTITEASTNPPPNAVFSFNCTDLDCSFDGSSSSDDGTITGYAWDFGDGNNASGATSNHQFAADGTYNVSFTVTDDEGATDNVTQSVEVTDSSGSAPIDLSVATRQTNRRNISTLTWSGATTNRVDVYIDGVYNRRTKNDGSWNHRTNSGSATYSYKLCDQNSSTHCSDVITVTFP